MHIVYFFTFDYSLELWDQSGALERESLFYSEVQKLNKNLNYTFVTFGGKKDNEIKLQIDNVKIIPAYTLVKYSKFKFIRILKSFVIPIKLKKLIKEVDLIKQNQLLGSWISIIFKIISKRPLFVRTGYDMFLFSKKENKSIFKVLLYYLLTQVTIFFSDLYTISNETDLLEMKKYFLKCKNIEVRPNWVNIPKRTKINFSSNKFLSVGRLEKQKNYIGLIDNFKNTKFKLLIVGKGSLKEEIANFATKNKVDLEIIEFLNFTKLQELYLDYTFFISSSKYEGHPKVIIEAMAAGCIVIASNIENNIEIIQHEFNGFLYNFNEYCFEDFYNKNILKNKNLENISTNAINTVKNNFSLSKLSKSELDDYTKLTNV